MSAVAGCPHRSSRLSRLVGMVVLYSMSWSSRHQQPPRPWAKESSPIAASPALVKNLHCEDCALHCSIIFYCFIMLMDLFGSLSLKNSGSWIALWDSGRASLRPQVMHVPLLDTSVSQALLHEAYGITSSPCKAPRSVLETTSVSSR